MSQKLKITVKDSKAASHAWPTPVREACHCIWTVSGETGSIKPLAKAMFGKHSMERLHRHGNKLLLYSHQVKIALPLRKHVL